MASKTYAARASAVRAARKAGDQFEVVQVWEDAGKSHWEFVTKPSTSEAAAGTTEVTPPVATAPQPEARASVTETPTVPVADDLPKEPKLVVEDYADQPMAPTPVVKAEPVPAPKPEVVKTSKSTVEKPTKAVWAIADEMKAANPQATRKQIVDECIQRGIAFYTARTQYQRWSKSKAVPVA